MNIDPELVGILDQAAAETHERAKAAGITLDRPTMAFLAREMTNLSVVCVMSAAKADDRELDEGDAVAIRLTTYCGLIFASAAGDDETLGYVHEVGQQFRQ